MKARQSNSDKRSRIRSYAFIVMAAVITAIAVAVTCALCFLTTGRSDTAVGGIDGVMTSANKSLTSAGTYDYTAAGAINNNDTISMTAANGQYIVVLPQGKYKLEVWGGQGGGASSSNYGGFGGYTYGQIEFSSITTLYVNPGGAGGYRTTSAAYNGGGRFTTAHPGGGGGGASHIATASGVLSSLGAGNNNILIVAGGGGGTGCGCAYSSAQPGKGGGGNNSGTSAPSTHHSTNRGGGYGASTSSAGRGGVGNGGGAGSFGQGGNQTSGGSGTGGGAGGGGYYGGGAGGSDWSRYNDNDDGSGGGGSGYINTSRMISGTHGGTTGANGVAASAGAAGRAVITAINVNQPPANKGANKTPVTIAGRARGTSGNTTITPDNIAVDPDATKTTLHFTDGSSSNLESFTTTANTGLFLNSGCSTLATNYIDWTWGNSRTLNITNFKRYPRSGVDGCTANGVLTLYARVRDSFGNATQHGWSVIQFNVSVPVNTVSERTATVNTTVVDSATGTQTQERYFLGMSTTNVAPEVSSTSSNIYNPSHTAASPRYTAILEKALRINTPFTISAADLLDGVLDGQGGRANYDQVFIALNSTTAITGSTKKFVINEYDDPSSTHKKNIYNTNRVLVANAFDQITLTCIKPDPTFQVFPVTLYVTEKTTAYGSAGAYTVPGIRAVSLDIVFKMDNTRPVLKDTDQKLPVLTVNTLEEEVVHLSDYYDDIDIAEISDVTHTIRNVKVATYEYIQLDKYGHLVQSVISSGDNAGKSYFNVLNGNDDPTAQELENALSSGWLEKPSCLTGFKNGYITDGASNTAFIRYSFSGDELTVTGLRATHDMYNEDRVNGRVISDLTKTDTGYDVDYDGGVANIGHFYILINVLDRNDTADEGIWLPLAIVVNNVAPTDLSTERGSAGASTMPTASGDPVNNNTFYFTPMGITITEENGRSTKPIGWYKSGVNYISTGLRPLAADADNFFTGNMLNGDSIGSTSDPGQLNELLSITSTAADVQSSVPGNARGEYFTVSDLDVYIPLAYMNDGRIEYNGPTETIDYRSGSQTVQVECAVVKGLKITLNNWTHNRYLFAEVGIEDSEHQSITVDIAVKVDNTAPDYFAPSESSKVAQLDYTDKGQTVRSSYSVNGGVATISYSVPIKSTVIVTPYDLFSDTNMEASGVSYPEYGFTLNGLSGRFNDAGRVFTVDGGAGTGNKEIKGIATAANAANINGGYNYSHSDYRTALVDTLDSLLVTRSFDKFSAQNMFTPDVVQDPSTNIDRLYFARSSDGSNLDGFTFDPYTADNANDFASPSIVGDSFVSYMFGSKLKLGEGEPYNIDYLIITAESRTQNNAPAVLELNVRDRTGAGTSGGVKTLRIEINVINSTPYIKNQDTVYQLTTDPIVGDENFTVDNANSSFSIKPSTLIINANNSDHRNHPENSFLFDNEGDSATFYTMEAVEVRDDRGRSADDNNVQYLGNYLRVSLTSEAMTITALNSSQNVNMLYIYFHATDGRASNGRDLDHAVCCLRIEIINSRMRINYGSDGFVRTEYGGGDNDLNLWTVESLNDTDMKKERYFASGSGAVAALNASGKSNAQIRTVVTDTDKLQGAVLSAVKTIASSSDATRGYYNADLTADPVDYKSAVPYIALQQDHVDNGSPVAVLLDILNAGIGDNRAETVAKYVESYDILYFIPKSGGGYDTYKASELRAADSTFVNKNHALFFDNDGRWKVTDWAVVIKPSNASVNGDYIRVRLMLRDETRFGGGTAGIKTAYENSNASSVDGFAFLAYELFVNDIGIVPYTYYNQFGGIYTVADGQDSNTNYVSTYDGDITSQYDADYGDLYLVDGRIETTGAEANRIKQRAANTNDDTNAGIHSGAAYNVDGNYTYDGNETAFKYSDTIKISGEGSATAPVYTYIPMSYFALRKAVVGINDTTGEIEYLANNYVSFDIGSNDGYVRSEGYARPGVITVSDGTNRWGGINDRPLSENPYVSFTSFDALEGNSVNVNNAGYSAALQGEYFNKHLAITTVNDDGSARECLTAGTSYTTTNAKNLVGNGHLMYLAGQTSGIQENLFGIGISKKHTRASAATLTVSISVVQCVYDSSVGTRRASTEAKDKATVTFKLDIGNSPITLAGSTTSSDVGGVRYDAKSGYYTKLVLNTGSDPASLVLSKEAVSGAVRTILYNDADTVEDNPEKSDKAYFFSDSLRSLNSWNLGGSAYSRVKNYTVGTNNAITFNNTSSDQYAQKSIQNYFGMRDKTTFAFTPSSTADQIARVDETFQPNNGKYGGNLLAGGREGYSSYFGTSVSADGTTLTISPNAKTEINSKLFDENASVVEKTRYYNERGLEYDVSAGADDCKGYYPLKVLVYDSHGDGFMAASYVALEIRVYIKSSAPTLASGLENISETNKNKKLEVQLPVNESYEFGISNVIRSNDLLFTDDGHPYWEDNFTELLNKENKSLSEQLKLETGTYLKSPYSDPRYDWHDTNNDNLLQGTAKLFDYNLPDVSRPDVMMWLEYKNSSGTGLSSSSKPASGNIHITVNRRTTVSADEQIADPDYGKRFAFKICFTDSDNHGTDDLTIYVNVTNQTPSIRHAEIDDVLNNEQIQGTLKMRVGDTFTIMTTPYDRFIDAPSATNLEPSVSARASTSYKTITTNQNSIDQKRLIGTNGIGTYGTLVSTSVDEGGQFSLHNYDRDNVESQHLGYLAIADDDTPWGLRIKDVEFYKNGFLKSTMQDKMYAEGSETGEQRGLDVEIEALSVCNNMPVTITVVDGEGAFTTFTMYITVESTRPSPITDADTKKHPRHSALSSVTEGGVEQIGVYKTYMISNSVTDSKLSGVYVNDPTAPNKRRQIDVYGEVTLPINQIAYDQDTLDNANIALYDEDKNYDMFTLNGLGMRSEVDPVTRVTSYFSDFFRVDVPADLKSFTIKCLTYNPNDDWDELQFYVRDCGNNVLENAIPITIRICTIYSSATNERQTVSGAVSSNGIINSSIVDEIKVKSYDRYVGEAAGEQSTYQFLRYNGVADSVDQENSSDWGIKDPDVLGNTYNLNYDVRVYALMKNDEQDFRLYNALDVEREASALFDINTTNSFWRLKDNVDMRDYLIAGRHSSGSNYTNINNQLVLFLRQYFVFDLGEDGVSLTFRPVTSTFEFDILFYVEVEKYVGYGRKITPYIASTKAGTLFYVRVEDSAPVVNTDDSVLSFEGRINESHIFTIYDETNPYGSMFTDSDANDMITIDGFTASSNLTEDYNNALEDADCDWQARQGVSRAIDIAINNTDETDDNGIPAHSLKITIKRRIDKQDEDGKYLDAVSFPVKFRGYDIMRGGADVELNITIRNSDFDMNAEKLDNDNRVFDVLGAGYEITRDPEGDKHYIVDSYIALDSAPINVNIVTGGWLSDPDFTSMSADTESFRLIRPDENSDAYADKYLYDAALPVYADGEDVPVATLTPIFGNNNVNADAYHFAGFTISAAESTKRGITGTAYMRILDRSGDPTRANSGITLTVRVTMLNAAPTVILGMDTTHYTVMGSDTRDLDPIDINVSDFVTDRNGDDIRIVSVLPLDSETIHCTASTDNSGNLVDAGIAENTDETICRIVPRKGYYGTQTIQIMAADGNLTTDVSARTVIFTVVVTGVYDFAQVQDLNSLTATRSLPKKITTAELFPDIADTYGDSDAAEGIKGVGSSGGAETSADGDGKTFNPGADYIITEVTPNATGVEVRKDADDDWQFVCSREMDGLQFTVRFIRAVDEGKTDATVYTKNFTANVGKNTAPSLNDNFKRDGGYTFTTREGEYGLDSNGTVTLTTGMLFSDVDLANGDKLVFDPAVSSVVSSTMCSLRFSDDGTLLYLTFNYRGETDLTLGVKDLTGETVKVTFTIKNIDRPEPSFFETIKISYETYPFIWLGVGIGVLALILFIILLIILLKRRKRKREELEAILVSEMELEEQMLRLSSGMNGPAPYQSYGYLPPTVNVQNDPGLMLGDGTPNTGEQAIGLNLGQSASNQAPNGGNGSSDDLSM